MSSDFKRSLTQAVLLNKLSRRRKRTLDDRHLESVRRLAAKNSTYDKLPRSRWSRSMWKQYNDKMAVQE